MIKTPQDIYIYVYISIYVLIGYVQVSNCSISVVAAIFIFSSEVLVQAPGRAAIIAHRLINGPMGRITVNPPWQWTVTMFQWLCKNQVPQIQLFIIRFPLSVSLGL